jgi:hypothetical protein
MSRESPGVEDGVFTPQQRQVIDRMLDRGTTPDAIARYLTRIHDLSETAEAAVRSLAETLAAQKSAARRHASGDEIGR